MACLENVSCDPRIKPPLKWVFSLFWCTTACLGKPALAYLFHFAVKCSRHDVELVTSFTALGTFSLRSVLQAPTPPVLSECSEVSLLLARLKPFSAYVIQLSSSHQAAPPHTVIHHLLPTLLCRLDFPLLHFPPTRKKTTTIFPNCLLPRSVLPQVSRLFLPTARSHSAYRASAHIFLKFIICSQSAPIKRA